MIQFEKRGVLFNSNSHSEADPVSTFCVISIPKQRFAAESSSHMAVFPK